MTMLTIIIIASGLAMDSFAVSIASGSAYKHLNIKHAFRIAFFFGVFQAIMPLIGFSAALTVKKYIEFYSHWFAFLILCAVGVKMIYESFKIKSVEKNLDPSNIIILFLLAIATSIDALAVGATLSIIESSLFLSALIIGLITFIFSLAGVFIGKKAGHLFEYKIEAVGGIILIAIGIKIIIEHIFS